MPFTYTALWNNLNRNNIGKWDLCQALGLSSSTMAKMTNGQHVSMDVLGRICEYLNCGLDDVVEYISDFELFARKIRRHVLDCTHTTYMDAFPEYRFVLSDDKMQRVCALSNVDIQAEITQCEQTAITKNKSKVQLGGTTTYEVQSSGNLIVMQGALTVVELFMEWLLNQITN